MHAVHRVLRDAQDSQVGKAEVHLGGRLTIGDQLEVETHAFYLPSSPVCVTEWVGGIKVMLPLEVVLPMPASTWPRGPRSRAGANM